MPVRLLAAFLLAASTAAARPSLNAEGLDRLAHYEVLTFTDPAGNGINRGKAIGVFDATPDEVFRVARDYERYTDYAPRIRSAKIVEQQGDVRAIVSLTTDLPWPVSDAWVEAQFEHERLGRDTYRIRFWQIRGSMRRYEGSIYIEPWKLWRGGGTSAVTYELLAEPDSRAPKRVINSRVAAAVAKWVHFLRQRINELRTAGRIHPEVPPDPSLRSTLAAKPPVKVGNVAQATKK